MAERGIIAARQRPPPDRTRAGDAAADRAGRERLLRCCARPPFALDRLRELDCEHLIHDLPKAGSGGSGPQRLTPLELLDRLAAQVPPPHCPPSTWPARRPHAGSAIACSALNW
ncbi:MAG: transposase [Burkholderiales bacterium]|nr:transposase [Burkholderiales bacterium]